MKRKTALISACIALAGTILLSSSALYGNDPKPTTIGKYGYFFVGGQYYVPAGSTQHYMADQLYVEYFLPAKPSQKYPVVMIHGGNQTGTNYTSTPDGREGWAQYFVSQGYAVYVVDQVGRGRSVYQTNVYGPTEESSAEGVAETFTAPQLYNQYPQAKYHTQWPGTGLPGDPIFDQFYASQVFSMASWAEAEAVNKPSLIALLEQIGPAYVLGHSQSGIWGVMLADARPDLVRGVIAVEPAGGPVVGYTPGGYPYGLTFGPLNYAPALKSPSDLHFVQQTAPDAPNLARCWIQASPVHVLPNLRHTPILVVGAQASFLTPTDGCWSKYLTQAGVPNTYLYLPNIGINGNGHTMMLEKNNLQIAAAFTQWLSDIQHKY
ncbi:MAG TPA: alpha/beta hydrolase [Gemmataceae bacterium]|nr:alpha/beta hydrolase [Gemmataceae bacterium]